MPLTNYKVGDRVRIKQTGHTGTVTEVREHAPSGRGGGRAETRKPRSARGSRRPCPLRAASGDPITSDPDHPATASGW